MHIARARVAVLATPLAMALVWLAIEGPAFAQVVNRTLHVTVVDQAGDPVPDLGPTDFIVREDKVKREVLRVEPDRDPMQIALLVDNSPSLRRSVNDVRAALTSFITAITADTPADGKHAIAIITFASRPTIDTNYTSDKAELLKGANRILPLPGTSPTLLDAIGESSEGLIKRHAARPVIVVVEMETLDASFRVYDRVLEPLAESGAPLFVFGIGTPQNEQQDRTIALGRGTEESGGYYDTVLASQSLATRMTRLANVLTHSYLVTYGRPDSLIPPKHVTVEAAKPGLVARGAPVNEPK